MNFNSLFFPSPKEHYSCITHFGELIYIPKVVETVKDPISGEAQDKLVLPHGQCTS